MREQICLCSEVYLEDSEAFDHIESVRKRAVRIQKVGNHQKKKKIDTLESPGIGDFNLSE